MPDEAREGFMFFRSYYEGAKELDDEQRLPSPASQRAASPLLSLCLTGARRERKQAAREAKASAKQTASKTEATRSNPEANQKP